MAGIFMGAYYARRIFVTLLFLFLIQREIELNVIRDSFNAV